MAGLEIVVRPIVFPNIRPGPAHSLPPAEDPSKGFCEIRGANKHVINLAENWSFSASYSKPVETERRVDEVRVYQEDEKGKINKENFVDIQVPNRIQMDEPSSPTSGDTRTYYYTRQSQKSNIEILRKDVIKKAGEGGGGEE